LILKLVACIKIIQKLQLSETATDFDLLIDLENIRKYAYVNFKNFSKDGIKIRPPTTVQAIRSINLKYKGNELKNHLNLRIGNDNIDMNVIGIALNPTATPLDCFTMKDLHDVRKVTENKNGFEAFVKVMRKTFINSKKNLYYWLFDNSIDKPKVESYVNYSTNDAQHNIKIMIGSIYNKYIDLVESKFTNYLNSLKEINIWEFNNLLKAYNKRIFNFNLTPQIINNLLEKVILEKIPEMEVIPDDIDSMIPGKRDKIINLPIIEIIKTKKKVITIGVTEIDVTLEMSNMNIPMCHHYIKWANILKISKKSDDFNQAVFDFVKQLSLFFYYVIQLI
jgi:hypothetical protein